MLGRRPPESPTVEALRLQLPNLCFFRGRDLQVTPPISLLGTSPQAREHTSGTGPSTSTIGIRARTYTHDLKIRIPLRRGALKPGYRKEPVGGEDPVCPEIIDPTVRLGRRFRAVGGEQLRGHGVSEGQGIVNPLARLMVEAQQPRADGREGDGQGGAEVPTKEAP